MDNFNCLAWLQPVKKQLGFSPKLTGMKSFATDELIHGFATFFGIKPNDDGDYTLLLELDFTLGAEGYSLIGGPTALCITGGCEHGLLYGAYDLLARLCLGEPVETMNVRGKPAVAHRILNHYNSTGIGIGIGCDLAQLEDYARLLASVGINEISAGVISDYPADTTLTKDYSENAAHIADYPADEIIITDESLSLLIRVANILRPFGICLVINMYFNSTDETYWNETVKRMYASIPDLAGFLIQAGRKSTWDETVNPANREPAQNEIANLIARALAPYGGMLYLRCAIQDFEQDWRDIATDRAKAMYHTFTPLDGTLDSNVILQIPHSPSDFRVRGPNSPLLGAMTQTHQGLELQIMPEPISQQRAVYAAAVQWEEIMDTPVTDERMTRHLIGHEVTAITADAGTGANWTHDLLTQANLYAFGRLTWNPAQTAEQLTRDWAALTFGTDNDAVEPITALLLESRSAYEKYTTPLGLGGMAALSPPYYPAPDALEYTNHGIYHRATSTHIGTDRTTHGTEFTAQYHPYVRDLYENIKTCPEKMLLFFHRLPYTHKLKTGKTIIQHIYDTHFEGVDEVQRFLAIWESLQEKIPQEAYTPMREKLSQQLQSAREWRDVVNHYFFRLTGFHSAALKL